MARRAALDILSIGNAGRDRKLQKTQAIVHFIYLHYAPEAHLDKLERLIKYLQLHYTIVSYSEAVERLRTGDGTGSYACLSFDDGFASCLDAAELFERESISACFFVCPDTVGRPIRDLHSNFPGSGPGDEVRTMNWDEIDTLRSRGHEIGSHTMSHYTLSELPHAEALAEVTNSYDELSQRYGGNIHFAWPRGTLGHFTPHLARAVRDVGYASCASAIRGAHSLRQESLYPLIRREHIDLSWPHRHQTYFISQGAIDAKATHANWPQGWIANP